jgi:hypothetical protein
MDITKVRKDIEKLYFDTCNIYEYRNVVNRDDYTTNMEEVLVHENVPCKLSYISTAHTRDGLSDTQYQITKLFINPDIEIKSGSKIVVTRTGVSTVYKNSGAPARHINHQEIDLLLEDDRA